MFRRLRGNVVEQSARLNKQASFEQNGYYPGQVHGGNYSAPPAGAKLKQMTRAILRGFINER